MFESTERLLTHLSCNLQKKVDFDAVKEMVQMGFDICEVIASLQNNLHNQVPKITSNIIEFLFYYLLCLNPISFDVKGYSYILYLAA